MNVIVLDTETTGLDKESDHVIDVAIRDWEDAFSDLWRVNPPKAIADHASRVHGITDEMVRDAPAFAVVAGEIKARVEAADVLVGYNPSFDVDILKREFFLANMECRWPEIIICAKRIWDVYDPPPPRSLTDAYKNFVNPAGFDGAHGAVADVKATRDVLRTQMEYFRLTGKAWADLDPERATWVGPSHHLRWENEDHKKIVVTFGKHRGAYFHQIDDGFLKWMLSKDFPGHVKAMSSYLLNLRANRGTDEQYNEKLIAAIKANYFEGVKG